MNHFPDPPPEQRLIAELRRAEALYRRALASIQSSLPQTEGSPEEITACLARLQPLMLQVRDVELELAPLRESWMSRGQPSGVELQQTLRQHEQLLKTLIDRIDALEHNLKQHRTAAIPGVDKFVKHQQMQKAYQQMSR